MGTRISDPSFEASCGCWDRRNPASVSRIGVLGHNISYSRSPALHQPWLDATAAMRGVRDEAPRYRVFDVAPEEVEHFWEECLGLERVCLNVTVPYKEFIYQKIEHPDPGVREISAVNTVEIIRGAAYAVNTDALAVTALLEPYLTNRPAEGIRAVILGAGGAAKAAVWALKSLGVPYITVFSRRQIAIPGAAAADIKDIRSAGEGHHIFINASPLGIDAEQARLLLPRLHREGVVFDMLYRDHPTGFASEAEECGYALINGLSMLTTQARKAFEYWFEDVPATEPSRPL